MILLTYIHLLVLRSCFWRVGREYVYPYFSSTGHMTKLLEGAGAINKPLLQFRPQKLKVSLRLKLKLKLRIEVENIPLLNNENQSGK